MDLICWRLLWHVHILRALGISLWEAPRAFRPLPPPLAAAVHGQARGRGRARFSAGATRRTRFGASGPLPFLQQYCRRREAMHVLRCWLRWCSCAVAYYWFGLHCYSLFLQITLRVSLFEKKSNSIIFSCFYFLFAPKIKWDIVLKYVH